MIPLWITATRPEQSRWGWALRSVGCPWVAHRVCPIPLNPDRASSLPRACSSASSFPALRTTWSSPPSSTATPAESYPRYSSRRSPSSRIGSACWFPAYPTIPHMRRLLSAAQSGSPTPMVSVERVQGTAPPAHPVGLGWPSTRTRSFARVAGDPVLGQERPGAPLEGDREGGLAVGADGVAPDQADPRPGQVDAVQDVGLDALVHDGGAVGVAGEPDAHLVVEQAVGRADLGRAGGDEDAGPQVEVDQVPGRGDLGGAAGDAQAVAAVGGEAVGLGDDRAGA